MVIANLYRLFVFVLAPLLLALPLMACVNDGGLSDLNNNNSQNINQSPDYTLGYQTGCGLASNAPKAQHDWDVTYKKMYQTSQSFASGWRAGYMNCHKGKINTDANQTLNDEIKNRTSH